MNLDNVPTKKIWLIPLIEGKTNLPNSKFLRVVENGPIYSQLKKQGIKL